MALTSRRCPISPTKTWGFGRNVINDFLFLLRNLGDASSSLVQPIFLCGSIRRYCATVAWRTTSS